MNTTLWSQKAKQKPSKHLDELLSENTMLSIGQGMYPSWTPHQPLRGLGGSERILSTWAVPPQTLLFWKDFEQ